MNNIFVTDIKIENVRHLKNINISLSENERKHLILTGKNGSGKTSVLDALSRCLNSITEMKLPDRQQQLMQRYLTEFEKLQQHKNENENDKEQIENSSVKHLIIESGVGIKFNEDVDQLKGSYEKGQFIVAYYKAERTFQADVPAHVEKVDLKDSYSITEEPSRLFIKYLLDLKVTEALANNGGKKEKAKEINEWFVKFEKLLRRIFDDDSLKLIFEEDEFKFYIKESNREIFDFNSLSSGFAAILDIVLDIIVRMEKATNRSFDFNIPGIVLIDEIETHLHLELQKTVLELLTTVFPNIQFIVSTHSPFVLNSLDNVIIYDLENKIKVENGLTNIPYEGIVEGYFKADSMSSELKKKYQRYKSLVVKKELTDDDFEEIAELEVFLDEIPDYLALNISTEYKRLKAEFEKREDV